MLLDNGFVVQRMELFKQDFQVNIFPDEHHVVVFGVNTGKLNFARVDFSIPS